MGEVKWIKITTDMFEDEKIDFIQTLPEADAIIVIWVRLLTLAGKCNADGYICLTEDIPYDPNMLAFKFRKPINIINMALDTFKKLGMIGSDENGFFLSNWDKHQNIDGLEKIREQNKIRAKNYREKQKLLSSGEDNVMRNVTTNVTDGDEITLCNAQVTQQNKNKNKNKDNIYIVQSEELWKLYPSKTGKATAIKKLPNLIKQYGFEQMQRTIERYIDYVEYRKSTDFPTLKYQNGSTFFNGRYVDYLDQNYNPEKEIASVVEKPYWDNIDS